MKECYFDNKDNFQKLSNESLDDFETIFHLGFECGDSYCLPIEDFCNPKAQHEDLLEFFPETICPGKHFQNFD